MQAVILAGGRGIRLGELTTSIPKPLLPVDRQPFLGWLIKNLRRYPIDSLIVLAGYKGEMILAYMKSCDWPGALYLVEDELLGTAGALLNAQTHLEESFFLFNGDSLFDFNYLDLPLHLPPGSLGAMALRSIPDSSRFGTVQLEGSEITSFREKSERGTALINGGVYFLRKEILNRITRGSSLERDIFPALPKGTLHGWRYDGFFLDIGIPEDLSRAQVEVPALFHRPALFLDRDGTINEDPGYLYRPEDFRWLPGAKEVIKQANDSGYLVIVVTNQAGVGRGHYAENDVHALHAWMNRQLRLEGAHIDAFYFCPHHPQSTVEPYQLDCSCRKPKPGMILKAVEEWDIDLSPSIGIGDQESDRTAYRNAGIERVGNKMAELQRLLGATRL